MTMTTETKARKFKVLIFKEEFKPYVKTKKEAEAELKKQFHGFTVTANSDDEEIQRFTDVTASMAVEPHKGNLVVIERDSNYFIERYPVTDGNFVGTVVSSWKKL